MSREKKTRACIENGHTNQQDGHEPGRLLGSLNRVEGRLVEHADDRHQETQGLGPGIPEEETGRSSIEKAEGKTDTCHAASEHDQGNLVRGSAGEDEKCKTPSAETHHDVIHAVDQVEGIGDPDHPQVGDCQVEQFVKDTCAGDEKPARGENFHLDIEEDKYDKRQGLTDQLDPGRQPAEIVPKTEGEDDRNCDEQTQELGILVNPGDEDQRDQGDDDRQTASQGSGNAVDLSRVCRGIVYDLEAPGNHQGCPTGEKTYDDGN